MNSTHSAAIDREFALARSLMERGDYDAAFGHLERAHVLGQEHVFPHVRSHWLMLEAELGRRKPVAALGQAVRIVLAAIGSAVGIVPTGNTGGTNVSMFARMPIAPELSILMRDACDATASISNRIEP